MIHGDQVSKFGDRNGWELIGALVGDASTLLLLHLGTLACWAVRPHGHVSEPVVGNVLIDWLATWVVSLDVTVCFVPFCIGLVVGLPCFRSCGVGYLGCIILVVTAQRVFNGRSVWWYRSGRARL